MYFSPSWRKKKYSFLKDNEVWWLVLVIDLFAIPGTIVLAKLRKHVGRITPNGVSLVSFVIFSLGVALLFVRPNDNAYFTLCFFLSILLDSIDGKLARLLGEASPFGAAVDSLFDMLKHALGLMLVGLALSVKLDNPYPLIITLPYALHIGVGHIMDVRINIVSHNAHPNQEVSNEMNRKTKWQLFCDKRGLIYDIYSQVEVIYVVVLLIGINLQNPTLFLLVGIYLRSILWIWRKCRKEAVNTSTCPD